MNNMVRMTNGVATESKGTGYREKELIMFQRTEPKK